ncbi:MAG: hypothetical protein QOK28_3111 [Actinomycetota bacterium]|jgi:hypothetical protein
MTDADAASLINAVDEAQSSTRVRLRARMPELSLLVAATAFASAIGSRHNHREAIEMLAFTAALSLAAWRDASRRRHLGGRIDRTGWIAVGLVLVPGIVVGLTVHGDARDIAIALCFAGGLLLLAVTDHSLVLAIPIPVLMAAVVAGHGTASSVLSFAAGLLCVFVVKESQRRRKDTTP